MHKDIQTYYREATLRARAILNLVQADFPLWATMVGDEDVEPLTDREWEEAICQHELLEQAGELGPGLPWSWDVREAYSLFP